jgi:uncharacterized protein
VRCLPVKLAALILALLAPPALLAAAFPSAVGFVNDFAGVLPESSRAEMETALRDTAAATSAEVVVVTVKSLDGMSVEEYAVRLFEQWGIGKKARDNGVLVLVVPGERAMRIEVGYGLEAVLPDGLAGEIIRTSFIPSFRDDDYSRGIQQGVARVLDIVRKHETASTQYPETDEAPPLLFVIPFLSIFVGLGSFGVGLGIRSKTYAPLLWGGLFGGMPLLMSSLFGPAALVLVLVAAAMVTWGYSKGASAFWASTLRHASASSTDGWTMGASGSSSDGEATSDSSDFGGGSSGGGGASGRW